jgi:hypothetical protein
MNRKESTKVRKLQSQVQCMVAERDALQRDKENFRNLNAHSGVCGVASSRI